MHLQWYPNEENPERTLQKIHQDQQTRSNWKCLTYITMGTQPLINGPETIYPKLSINLWRRHYLHQWSLRLRCNLHHHIQHHNILRQMWQVEQQKSQQKNLDKLPNTIYRIPIQDKTPPERNFKTRGTPWSKRNYP